MKKRLFVVDGHALCYRAYFAFIRNPLVNSKGQNTSAIFGFARMLFKLLGDQKPDYLLVAFDPPKKSFRFSLYPEYKANRQKMPDDLRSQIEEIKQMLSVLRIRVIEEADFEADDVLGTIARNFAGEDLEVVLVTGDKDAYQLVNDNVKIYANKKGITEFELYDRKGVEEKLGLEPEKVIDYMALAGDSSDNVPGVKGIGEKTALRLITDYGSLAGVYEHLGEIKGKLREILERDREMALLSRDLVTIRTDLPFEVELAEALPPDLRTGKARDYFHRLEMESIVKELFAGEETPAERKAEEKDYRVLRDPEELEEAIRIIRGAGEVSVDTETTSVHPVEAELVGVSLSVRERQGWYLPVMGSNLFDGPGVAKKDLLPLLKPVLEDSSIKKIGQNIKYDLLVLKNVGIQLAGVWFDTMVASYLLDASERRHNLDDMAQRYLGYKTITFEELVGKGKKAVPITEVPLELLAEYAIEDADITLRLYRVFLERLAGDELEELFYSLEMPLVSILARIEQDGVMIDTAYFKKLAKENEKLLRDVEEKIYRTAGSRFNISSTRELAVILFQKLGLKPVKKTKTGFSTDIQVLESLKGQHEIIDYLISFRTLIKLKTTYIDTLPALVSPRTGRIHTSYNQTVVATGRLSSSDPNLQNIPVRDELGRKIRQGFVPSGGCILLSADYSQIELRLTAHISGDSNMIKAFDDGIDIHNLTAASVFGVPIGEVTPDMRRQAKIINFATIYGVSPYGLSQQADISMRDASEFINRYFETYPGVRRYIDDTIAFARKNGYVKTLLGRRRPVPDIGSDNNFRREGAERVAINTPIQGTSADLIKVAMINIQRVLDEKRSKTKMIMQVHDELVFEVPEEEKDIVEKIVKREMEHAISLDVPIVVDTRWGKNWAEAH